VEADAVALTNEESVSASSISPRAFRIIGLLVIGGAIATCLGTLAFTAIRTVDLWSLAVIALLTLANELARMKLYGDNSSSQGTILAIAAGVLFGLPFLALMEAISLLAGDIKRRRVNFYTAYNMALCTLSGVGGGGILVYASDHGVRGFALLGVGAIAGLVYYVINIFLVSFSIGVLESRDPRAVMRDYVTWLGPQYMFYGVLGAGIALADRGLGVLGIAVFAMPAVAMRLATTQYVSATEDMVEKLQTSNQTLEALLAENRGLLASASRGHLQLIRGLAQAIDAKDPYTAGHTARVAQYSVRIAAALGLDDTMCRDIEHGALLHDIGKIGVPDAVLTKAGPLDDGEWEAMRRHPMLAISILDGVEMSQTVIDMVRSHHENMDGTGYPDHLTEDELSIPARIARVADAFDAMTTDRPYRDALSVAIARSELRRCMGTQFAPEIVEIFEDLIDRGQIDHILGQRTLLRQQLEGLREAS
jgi:putative nucleotidyltransferase with HDIG domain